MGPDSGVVWQWQTWTILNVLFFLLQGCCATYHILQVLTLHIHPRLCIWSLSFHAGNVVYTFLQLIYVQRHFDMTSSKDYCHILPSLITIIAFLSRAAMYIFFITRSEIVCNSIFNLQVRIMKCLKVFVIPFCLLLSVLTAIFPAFKHGTEPGQNYENEFPCYLDSNSTGFILLQLLTAVDVILIFICVYLFCLPIWELKKYTSVKEDSHNLWSTLFRSCMILVLEAVMFAGSLASLLFVRQMGGTLFFLMVQLRFLFTAMFVPLLLKSPNICKDKIELDEHIFISLQQLDTGSVDPSKLSELSFDLRDIVNPTVQGELEDAMNAMCGLQEARSMANVFLARKLPAFKKSIQQFASNLSFASASAIESPTASSSDTGSLRIKFRFRDHKEVKHETLIE